MKTRLTKHVIDKFRKVHGDKYNYDKVIYVKSNIPVIITCPIHGDFEQTPANHYQHKCNCPKYSKKSKTNKIQNIGINNKKEYIICSAIKRIEPRESQGNHLPYHTGYNDIMDVELGYRHHDIYLRYGKELLKQRDAQGFFTSNNRFVDRKEAAKIAFECGQINKEVEVLFSENLY